MGNGIHPSLLLSNWHFSFSLKNHKNRQIVCLNSGWHSGAVNHSRCDSLPVVPALQPPHTPLPLLPLFLPLTLNMAAAMQAVWYLLAQPIWTSFDVEFIPSASVSGSLSSFFSSSSALSQPGGRQQALMFPVTGHSGGWLHRRRDRPITHTPHTAHSTHSRAGTHQAPAPFTRSTFAETRLWSGAHLMNELSLWCRAKIERQQESGRVRERGRGSTN